MNDLGIMSLEVYHWIMRALDNDSVIVAPSIEGKKQ